MGDSTINTQINEEHRNSQMKIANLTPSGAKFGTWDGVFVSCIVNIFGVILFLRMGYIVGNIGIWASILLIFFVFLLSIITILSTAGICNTCHLKKGGLYAIVKQALGTQIGGAIGVLYFFGLATVNAVFILGFAEAFCQVCKFDASSIQNIRIIGLIVEVIVVIIVLLGVHWVIKLQIGLLILLFAAILNFIIGSFIKMNDFNNFKDNLQNTSSWDAYFEIFGLFFATTTGIMAGANMSGDLKHPSVSIPVGTIAAVSLTSSIYATFILICANVGNQTKLIADYSIVKEYSASKALYFIGLFIASLTSSFGVFVGAPRVMQGIGEDIHVPGIKQLAVGWGDKSEPVRATFLVAIITSAFVIIGELNQVANVMTIILCIAYAITNYAYFALATGGLREESRARLLLEFGKNTNNVDDQTINIVQNMAKECNRTPDDFKKPPRIIILLTNRWISLFNSLFHISLMFLIKWWQGMLVIAAFFLLYIYIGVLNKNDNRLGDADFSLREWLNPLQHPSRKKPRKNQLVDNDMILSEYGKQFSNGSISLKKDNHESLKIEDSNKKEYHPANEEL